MNFTCINDPGVLLYEEKDVEVVVVEGDNLFALEQCCVCAICKQGQSLSNNWRIIYLSWLERHNDLSDHISFGFLLHHCSLTVQFPVHIVFFQPYDLTYVKQIASEVEAR
jgi:hypothetical protein